MGCCGLKKPKRLNSTGSQLCQAEDNLTFIKVEHPEEVHFSSSSRVFHKQTPILNDYKVGGKLGEGAYGAVRQATHLLTSRQRAIKSLRKGQITSDLKHRMRFCNEIDVLRQTDHPNILKLYEFYEDKHCYYLVTELLTGGELFDYIVKHQWVSEDIAAHFTRQILSAINYCHSKGIVHRDLKPENLLLEQESSNATLKVIDFGTSALLHPSEKLTKPHGTPYYIAPEVLDGSYDTQCDIWSCGVILYILLCGSPPFKGSDETEIFRMVKAGRVRMTEPAWAYISPEAKDLVLNMLEVNPRTRVTASEALAHPWFQKMHEASTLPNLNVYESISNLKKFRAHGKLQAAVLAFISHQLVSEEETKHLTEAFQKLDANGDGKLSREELLEGYKATMDAFDASAAVEQIMKEVDTDANGYIEYSEFLMASMKKDKLLCVENLEATFQSFDIDGNGTISATELRQLLGEDINAKESVWTELILQVDQNGDGEIDIKEFKEMMLKYF